MVILYFILGVVKYYVECPKDEHNPYQKVRQFKFMILLFKIFVKCWFTVNSL